MVASISQFDVPETAVSTSHAHFICTPLSKTTNNHGTIVGTIMNLILYALFL